MSVASFSQITISQEDYDRLPGETRTQNRENNYREGYKKEKSKKYLNMQVSEKEIGVAVNETLKSS